MTMPTIPDAEELYRRVHPTQIDPQGRPSSSAFKDPELSVDRSSLTNSLASLGGRIDAGYGLAAFPAGVARHHGQEVVADPVLLNPAHALVRGHKPRSVAKALANAAIMIIPAILPPGGAQ